MEKKSREFEWFLGRIAHYFNVEVDEKKVANESYILCRDERDADGEYFSESEIELLPEEILFYVMSYVDDTQMILNRIGQAALATRQTQAKQQQKPFVGIGNAYGRFSMCDQPVQGIEIVLQKWADEKTRKNLLSGKNIYPQKATYWHQKTVSIPICVGK